MDIQSDCVFCKIVKGESPCFRVYEDESFLGFLNIFPQTKGHALIIPKIHYRWVDDVPQFGAYWEGAKKIAKAAKAALKPLFNSYLTHGLKEPHAHIHIIPRYDESDRVSKIVRAPNDELEEIRKKIVAAQ